MTVWLREELWSIRLVGRHHGQPRGFAQPDIGLLHESQHRGVEGARAPDWSSTSAQPDSQPTGFINAVSKLWK